MVVVKSRQWFYILIIFASILFFCVYVTFYEKTNEFRSYKQLMKQVNSDFDDIIDYIPNLPIDFYKIETAVPNGFNKTCARFPKLHEIEYNNLYWQTLRTSNGTFQLLSSHLDTRDVNKLWVRVVAMYDRIQPTLNLSCQFWYEDKNQPIIYKAVEYKYLWHKEWGNYANGIYQPYLINCPLAANTSDIPKSVSLVEKPCQNATNNLRIVQNKSNLKKKFVVCVKGLNFPQDGGKSIRLIEWIELLNILGADKIFFYEYNIHENIRRVLKYYQQQKKIVVIPSTLPGYHPQSKFLQHLYLQKNFGSKRLTEVIQYNDCFYRNINDYHYVILLDTDEVIVPKIGTWSDLMVQIEKQDLQTNEKKSASYNARNVYFFDNFQHQHEWFEGIPKYMHMLQHVYRSKNYTKPNEYVKCFHDTKQVLALHNHFPIYCLNGTCKSFSISTEHAQLQHYRSDCVSELMKGCDELKNRSVMDNGLWRFKSELIEGVKRTIETLDLLELDD